jgi:hypothetical protein
MKMEISFGENDTLWMVYPGGQVEAGENLIDTYPI